MKKVLVDNEEWLKKLVLGFAESFDGAADWPAFFSGLVASAPASRERDALAVAALDAVGQPMLVLDREFDVVLKNRAAVDMLGGEEGVPLRSMAPWLAGKVEHECAKSGLPPVVPFDVVRSGEESDEHFSVTLSGFDGGWVLLLNDVTLRVEALRDMEKDLLRSAQYLNVVGAMIVALDASSSVIMVNETSCRILGYEERELVGRNWVEASVPEEQRDEVLDYLYLVFSGQTEVDGELSYYVTTKDGEDRLIQWQHKLLTNEMGMPIGVLCSGMDVTEQRAVEDALAEKELWLRSTFVALGEAVFILTPEMKIIDANPAAEAMFGMTNEELVDSPVEALHVDAVLKADFMARCREAFDRGEQAMFEFPLLRKNGEIFPSEHSVSLITSDDGSLLGIVNTIKDISARKRSERILRESEEKFRRIFESMEEGYLVTDMEGLILMVNPATCGLLGYSEEELVGTVTDKFYQDKEKQKLLRESIIKGENIRGLRAQAVRKDGAVITVDGNAHLILNEKGAPMGMEGTFRDITHQIEAEKVLKEREQQYRAFFENNHAIMILTDPRPETWWMPTRRPAVFTDIRRARCGP